MATSYSQRTTEEAKSNASLSRLSYHQRDSQWGNCRSVGNGMNGAWGLICLDAIKGRCDEAVGTDQSTAHWAPQGPASLNPPLLAQTRDCSPPKSNQPSPRGSKEVTSYQRCVQELACARGSFEPKASQVLLSDWNYRHGQLPAQAQPFTRG